MSMTHSLPTQRFKTLLRREWMQHHVGWLAVMLAPLAIALLTLPFKGSFEVDGDFKSGMHALSPASVLALAAWGGTTLAVVGLTLLAQLFQLPSLARRDAQDRSLEFWMSLPGRHSEHLAATLLAHTLMVLLVALGVGLVSGLVVAPLVVGKALGFAALSSVQWGAVLQFLLPGLVRVLGGLPLFVLWLAPVVLLLMAASAWLKRWGVPLVVVATVVLCNLPATKAPVRAWLMALAERVNGAFFLTTAEQAQAAGLTGEVLGRSEVGVFWQAIGQDLLNQLSHLASPMFLSALAISMACFAALVYRRQHHL